MINVAFIAASLQTGGAERQWVELIRGMDPKQFNVIVICLYELGTIGKQMQASGVKCYTGLMKSRLSFGGVGRLAKVLKDESIDVVFLWNQPVTMLYSIPAARLAGRDKIVAAIHNTGYTEGKHRIDFVNRLLMPFVKKVVALGVPHKEYVIQKEHVAPDRVVIIYNGVEIANYEITIDKKKKKAELGIPADAKVVGIVARLHKAKRHDVFLKAAKRILAEYPDVYFVIVGEGEEKQTVQDLILELGLSRNVKMLGLRRDIAEIVHTLDAAVLSSDPLVETLPMSIIEAMASSVPVVSTNVGSLSDLVIDGDNGFLVGQGDFEGLSKAILKILKDDALAARMGRRGHEIALEKFSREGMVKGYEDLFRSQAVLRGNGGPA